MEEKCLCSPENRGWWWYWEWWCAGVCWRLQQGALVAVQLRKPTVVDDHSIEIPPKLQAAEQQCSYLLVTHTGGCYPGRNIQWTLSWLV